MSIAQTKQLLVDLRSLGLGELEVQAIVKAAQEALDA